MPHEVGWGVGGGGAYQGAEVHTGRQRPPEGTNGRRQGRPRLQTCVDRPTEQLSRPDFQQEVSPMPSPSIVCTGSAHRVVLSHPYGDSQCRLLSYQSSQERQTSGPYLEDTHLTEAHQNSPRLFRRHSLETSESAKRGRHISPHMSKMMIIVNAGTLNKSLLNRCLASRHGRLLLSEGYP